MATVKKIYKENCMHLTSTVKNEQNMEMQRNNKENQFITPVYEKMKQSIPDMDRIPDNVKTG